MILLKWGTWKGSLEGSEGFWLGDKEDDRCLRREKRICVDEVWRVLFQHPV